VAVVEHEDRIQLLMQEKQRVLAQQEAEARLRVAELERKLQAQLSTVNEKDAALATLHEDTDALMRRIVSEKDDAVAAVLAQSRQAAAAAAQQQRLAVEAVEAQLDTLKQAAARDAAAALVEHERCVGQLQDELRSWRTRVSNYQSDMGVETARAEAAEARAATAEAAVAAAEQLHAQLMTALETKRHEASAAQHAHLQVRFLTGNHTGDLVWLGLRTASRTRR
jgi:chromosome segregation ATPase